MKTVWAVQHIGYEDLGSFETTLKREGFDVRYVCSARGDLAELDVHEPDLLVILGGPMGAYETGLYPFLTHEINFAEARIAAGLPLLGVCLGAQITARALGARVYKGEVGKEIGWHPVYVNDAGMQTPVRHLDHAITNMMHWHGDTFDQPQGATLLASSDLYACQAYSYASHVMALQCHPEVTPEKLERWYLGGAGEIAEIEGLTVNDLRRDAEAHGALLTQQADKFLTEWLHMTVREKNVIAPEQTRVLEPA